MRNAAPNKRGFIAASYRWARRAAIVRGRAGRGSGALALWFAALVSGACASTPQLLDEVERALRAPESPLSLPAIHAVSKIEMAGGIEGTVEVWASRRPARMREELEIAGTRQVTTLLGDRAWIQDPNGHVRELEGHELSSILISHSLLFHEYLKPRVDELEIREGPDPRSVVLAWGGGPQGTLFFDDTSVPVRFEERQQGTRVTLTYSDWRTVNGYRFPHTTKQSTGDPRFDITVQVTSLDPLDELPPDAVPDPVDEPPRDASITNPQAARQIPVSLAGNLVLVPVTIGEQDCSFLLDTGAGATLVSRRLADRLDLDESGRLEARGAGGSESASFVRLPALRLPGVKIEGQTVVTLSLDGLSRSLGRTVDGILGYDFLSRFAIELDYPNRRMSVFAQGEYEPRPQATALPLVIEANVPRIQARLDGVHEGSLLLDLGNDHPLLLHAPFVREHGLDELAATERTITGIGGHDTLYEIPVATLALGPLEFSNVNALGSTNVDGATALESSIGNLGAALFREAVVAFDYSERSVWIRLPNARSASPR